MAKRKRIAGQGDMSFNMTPMIDCTFQLIIFFLLAGTFASMENIRLEVPRIHEPQAVDVKLQNKVVVNVPLDPKASDNAQFAGRAECWAIGPYRIRTDNLTELRDLLEAAKKEYEQHAVDLAKQPFQLEIRADGQVGYDQVEPILQVAGALAIPKINITASMEGAQR